MSFGDVAPEHPPPRLLVYRCRLAGCCVAREVADPETELRRAIENRETLITHACMGTSALCDLVGTGPAVLTVLGERAP